MSLNGGVFFAVYDVSKDEHLYILAKCPRVAAKLQEYMQPSYKETFKQTKIDQQTT
jgi:hypothetical protein